MILNNIGELIPSQLKFSWTWNSKKIKHDPSTLICLLFGFKTIVSEVIEKHKQDNHGSNSSTISLKQSSDRIRKKKTQMTFVYKTNKTGLE